MLRPPVPIEITPGFLAAGADTEGSLDCTELVLESLAEAYKHPQVNRQQLTAGGRARPATGLSMPGRDGSAHFSGRAAVRPPSFPGLASRSGDRSRSHCRHAPAPR